MEFQPAAAAVRLLRAIQEALEALLELAELLEARGAMAMPWPELAEPGAPAQEDLALAREVEVLARRILRISTMPQMAFVVMFR